MMVKTLATNNDTNWYQQAAIEKMNVVPLKNSVGASVSSRSKVTTSNSISSINSQNQKEFIDAMKAPISNNQLNSNQYETTPINFSSPFTKNGESFRNQESDQNMQGEKNGFLQYHQFADSDYLSASLKNAESPYALQAGTIIPGILITGINSDLPGQITGQVRSNVYDSISGKYLLVPQGAKLTGLYDSQVAYGQERVLVVWKRIIFPNGQSIDLNGMPGTDLSGYAGFHDQVNNHYKKIFGSVVLLSILSAGAQLSQPQNSNNPFAAPTINQTLAQSLGSNIANTGAAITSKNINIQPTLEIRSGYLFNISVTKDIIFPGAYAIQ